MNRCEEEKGALEVEVGGAPGQGEDGEADIDENSRSRKIS